MGVYGIYRPVHGIPLYRLYTRICMYTANIGYIPYMHSPYIGLNIGDLGLYLPIQAHTAYIG